MKNFYEFTHHFWLINKWTLKYAIQSLKSEQYDKNIEFGYDYLTKIRKAFILDGWKKRNYFYADFDYSMECHFVHVDILEEIVELLGFKILENEYNTRFKFEILSTI